jgi:CRP/FNR family transcriptional regulator, nitrogen oxide reductase regulator
MSLPPVSRVRPHPCSACALHQSFCHFPDALRAAFDGLKTTVAYWQGETIFHEGSRCQSVFAVCEGSAKLITTSTEGRALLLRFVGPGEMLGLAEAVLGRTPYECSAIAAENSILAVIPHETFLRFIGTYPEACLSLTLALSMQYKLAQRETKFLGFGDQSIVRLARLLLEWSAQFGVAGEDGAHIPLHVTHGDLAQAIGATRETVTRLLAHLSRAGLVERRANALIVLRPAELALITASSPVTIGRDADALHGDECDLSMLQEPCTSGGTP